MFALPWAFACISSWFSQPLREREKTFLIASYIDHLVFIVILMSAIVLLIFYDLLLQWRFYCKLYTSALYDMEKLPEPFCLSGSSETAEVSWNLPLVWFTAYVSNVLALIVIYRTSANNTAIHSQLSNDLYLHIRALIMIIIKTSILQLCSDVASPLLQYKLHKHWFLHKCSYNI